MRKKKEEKKKMKMTSKKKNGLKLKKNLVHLKINKNLRMRKMKIKKIIIKNYKI